MSRRAGFIPDGRGTTMNRELTVERRGDLFHLVFHDYMGPWEGHQIEAILDLEEVEPPDPGVSDDDVLGANQAYLWHPMEFQPELHALVTEDRLPRVAQIVRDRDVEVIAGADLLPEPPAERIHVDPGAGEGAESYIARIEERHRSTWDRGPKAVAGAFLLRVVPLLLVIYAIVLIGRHTGDHHEAVTLNEMVARSRTPLVHQTAWERWNDPDHSHLVRTQIRRILYAHGETMIVGDGDVLDFAGAGDVEPWIDRARMTSSPLVIDAVAADGRIHVEGIRCAGKILATDLDMQRIVHIPGSQSPPRRDTTGAPGTFVRIEGLGEGGSIEHLDGQCICVDGTIERVGTRRVLHTADGCEVTLDLSGCGSRLADFVDALAGRDCPVTVDLEVDGPRARVMSVSAQNHHVVARIPRS